MLCLSSKMAVCMGREKGIKDFFGSFCPKRRHKCSYLPPLHERNGRSKRAKHTGFDGPSCTRISRALAICTNQWHALGGATIIHNFSALEVSSIFECNKRAQPGGRTASRKQVGVVFAISQSGLPHRLQDECAVCLCSSGGYSQWCVCIQVYKFTCSMKEQLCLCWTRCNPQSPDHGVAPCSYYSSCETLCNIIRPLALMQLTGFANGEKERTIVKNRLKRFKFCE